MPPIWLHQKLILVQCSSNEQQVTRIACTETITETWNNSSSFKENLKNTKRILPTWLWTHFSLPGTNAAIHDSCQNHAKNSFICVVFVDFANKSIFFALVLPFIRRNPLYTGKLWPSFLALFFMGYLDGIPAVLSDKPNRDPSPHPKNDARNQLKKVLLTPKMRHGTKSSRQLWPTFCNYSEEWSRPFLVCP